MPNVYPRYISVLCEHYQLQIYGPKAGDDSPSGVGSSDYDRHPDCRDAATPEECHDNEDFYAIRVQTRERNRWTPCAKAGAHLAARVQRVIGASVTTFPPIQLVIFDSHPSR